MKKIISFLLAILLVFLGLESSLAENSGKELQIDCDNDVIIPVGYAQKIEITQNGESLNDKSLSWTSTDESVAIFSEEQKSIVALSKGNATITIFNEDSSSQQSINVHAEEFDLVFVENKTLNASYKYTVTKNKYTVKCSSKNGCVDLPKEKSILDVRGSGEQVDQITVNPKKAGADTITISANGYKTVLSVFVHIDAVTSWPKRERLYKFKGAINNEKYTKQFNDCTISVSDMKIDGSALIIELTFDNKSNKSQTLRDVFTLEAKQRKKSLSLESNSTQMYMKESLPAGESYTYQIKYELSNSKNKIVQFTITNTGVNDSERMFLFINPKTQEWGYQFEVPGAESQ